MSDFGTAREVRRVVQVAGLRPPPKLSLSQWADEHFRLSAESSAQVGRWKTLPYQRELMDVLTDPTVTHVSVMKSARVGFALAVSTPIPTATGWSTMGDLKVGDRVFDEKGNLCTVKFKSSVFTDHACFKIRFCDGSEIVADAGHRWLVESDVALEHLMSGASIRTGRPKPNEVKTFKGVINTAEMVKCMHTSRGRNALTIRNAEALNTPLADLPVPPYTLGLWLGDGHMVSPRITQHRSDVETATFIEREGIRVAIGYPDLRYPNNATYWLDCNGGLRDPSPWAAKLRKLGVLSNKHIPGAYLRAHKSQRLELLRGLMDSDGTSGRNGRAEFNNTNENLARGVYELAASLGMKATLRQRAPQRPGYLPQWRVNFKPHAAANPFNLSRKAARVGMLQKPSITMRRRIVAVDPVGPVPVQCIEVDSPSHLFLAGKQMVPTHNTKVLNAFIGYSIHQDPCPVLVVQPTVDDAKGYSKEEIAPMLRDCPALAAITLEEVEEFGQRGATNSTLHKRFPGGVLSLVGANSGAGFRRISRKRVLFDEVDGYPLSAGADGDPIRLGTTRTEYYWDRKIVAGSTPLIAGHSRIEQMFEAGDKRRFYVPCPHCGHFDYLVFTQRDSGGHYMVFEKSNPEAAHFVCSKNGCVIEHKDKRSMVAAGEWRAEKPFEGHASFHIWAAYSYSPNATWGQLAKEFLDAKHAGREQLKTFINTVLGETWQESGDAPEWERLYQRREQYQIGSVPDGVKFLTAGVDVQKDRWVYEVVGWGDRKESWSIDAGVLMGDTSNEQAWQSLDDLLGRTYAATDGTVYAIKMLAVDSGYNTQMVYNWGRRHERNRVIAVKGVSTARTLISSPTAVDVSHRGQRIARGYKVWPVGVDIAKSELYGWLRMQPPTVESGLSFPPGFCHFPEYGDDYFKQLTSEHLVSSVSRTGFSRFEWQMIPGRENHWLDARVYNRAAAAVLGIDRMALSKPANQPTTEKPTPPEVRTQPQPAKHRASDFRFPSRPGRGKSWLGR